MSRPICEADKARTQKKFKFKFKLNNAHVATYGKMWISIIQFILAAVAVGNVSSVGDIIYAVNAGGGAVVGSFNINYSADPSDVGESYEHNKDIYGIYDEDQILYRTERYNYDTFGYDIPLKEPGSYVLVLKFSEVYFRAKDQKVFDIAINNEYVVENLDIFDKAGFEHGYDEYIEITAYNDFLMVNEYKIPFNNQYFRLDFLKGTHDNPKINAFYLMRGTISDVAKLPMSQRERRNDPDDILDDDNNDNVNIDDQDRDQDQERGEPAQKKEMHFHENVHGFDDDIEDTDRTSYVVPIFMFFGALVPIYFFLYQL